MEAGAHLRRCYNIDSDAVLPHYSPKTLHERSNGGFRCGILECFWPIDEARHTSLEDQATIAITISLLKASKVVSRELCSVKQSLEVDIYCRKRRLLRFLIWVFLYVSTIKMEKSRETHQPSSTIIASPAPPRPALAMTISIDWLGDDSKAVLNRCSWSFHSRTSHTTAVALVPSSSTTALAVTTSISPNVTNALARSVM